MSIKRIVLAGIALLVLALGSMAATSGMAQDADDDVAEQAADPKKGDRRVYNPCPRYSDDRNLCLANDCTVEKYTSFGWRITQRIDCKWRAGNPKCYCTHPACQNPPDGEVVPLPNSDDADDE